MIKWKEIELCDCICHVEGKGGRIMHAFACCDLCYATYIDEEGKIIPELIYPLLRKDMLERTKDRSVYDIHND